MNVLIVAPHCDDAEIGCGGYIARLVAGGHTVKVLVVTSGMYSNHTDSDYLGGDANRIEEFTKSMTFLGAASSIMLLGYDSALNMYPTGMLVNNIEQCLDECKPHEFIFALPSFHQDHRIVYDACVAAVRPTKKYPNLHTILAYEYPLSIWGEGMDFGSNGLYVHTTEHHNTKLEALSFYKSQIANNSECPLSLDSITTLAKKRGFESGAIYAEFFHVLKKII